MRPMSSWRIWLMLLDWTRRNKHSYLPCCISLASLLVVCLFIHLASHAPSRETPAAKVFSLMWKLVYTCLHYLHMSWPHWTPHLVSTHETYETTRFASVLWVGGPLAGLSHMVPRPWRRIMQCLSNSVGPTFLNSSNSSNWIYLNLSMYYM